MAGYESDRMKRTRGQRLEARDKRADWYSLYDVGGASVDGEAVEQMSENIRAAILEGVREKGGDRDG